MPLGPTGLFRTAVASSPAPMSAVFEALKRGPYRYRFEGLSGRGMYGGKVPLQGRDNGEGWEFFEFAERAYVVICDCVFEEDRTELIPSDELTEFHYTVSGPALLADRCSEISISDVHLVACRAGGEATYRITCLKGRRRSVALYLQHGFLDVLFDPACKELQAMQKELSTVGSSQVYFRPLSINRRVVELVDQLSRNPFTDRRRLFFAEAKCTELICETIELLRAHHRSPPDGLVLTARDIESLECIRKLIREDLATGHSIKSLAKMAGMNSTKLKAGFRFLFGCTVHQSILKERMDRALQLLAEKKASVGEVAFQIGYQHQSSFAFAFRKYFGFCPTRVRAIASPGETSGGTLPSARQA